MVLACQSEGAFRDRGGNLEGLAAFDSTTKTVGYGA